MHPSADLYVYILTQFENNCEDFPRNRPLYANRIFMYICIKSSIGTKSEVG